MAAPLLAGFSITLIGLVLGAQSEPRAATAALDVLAVATLALLGAVQASFNARRYAVLPNELEAWWPDHNELDRSSQLAEEQAEHHERFDRWATAFRVLYNAGVLLLLLGLALILVPPAGESASHWIPTALFVGGFIIELALIVGGWAGALAKHWWRH